MVGQRDLQTQAGEIMADEFLNGLNAMCVAWLMNTEASSVDFRSLDDAVGFFDLEVVKGPMKKMKWDDDFAVRALFAKEYVGKEVVLGRTYHVMPMARVLGLGLPYEQKFVLGLVGDVPVLTMAHFFKDGKVIFTRLQHDYLVPSTSNICVDLKCMNKVLYSATMRGSEIHGLAPVQEDGVQKRMSKNVNIDSEGLWDFFSERMKMRQQAMYQRTVSSYVWENGQPRLMFERRAVAQMERFTTQDQWDSLKGLYIQRRLDTVRCFLSANVTPAELTVNDDELDMLKVEDVLFDPKHRPRLSKRRGKSQRSKNAPAPGKKSMDSSAEHPSNVCSSCGAAFKRKYERDRHVLSVHRRERHHKCTQCTSTFFQISHLKAHIDHVHKHIRENECDVCGKAFTSKYKVKRHAQSVHPQSVAGGAQNVGPPTDVKVVHAGSSAAKSSSTLSSTATAPSIE